MVVGGRLPYMADSFIKYVTHEIQGMLITRQNGDTCLGAVHKSSLLC